MEYKIQEFIGGIQTPIKKLSVSQLRDREETWRALWSWIPEDVKYLIYRIGSQVRIMRRDYKGSLGELGEIKFEGKEYEIVVYEKRYNENDGKFWLEHKVIKIPSGTVMMLEFMLDRELAEVEPPPELVPLEEVDDAVLS